MKRFWTICAIMAALCSCTESTELDTPEEEQLENDGGVSITATITMPQDDDDSTTRIFSDYGGTGDNNWYFKWNTDDSVYFVYVDESTEDYTFATLDSQNIPDVGAETATFEGDIDRIPTDYYILYTSDTVNWGSYVNATSSVENASNGIDTKASFEDEDVVGETLILDISQGQTGKIDNLVMISENFENTDDSYSVNIEPYLYHVGAFLVLDISFSSVPEHWRGVTVKSISCSGVNTKCKISPVKYTCLDDDFYDYPEEQPAITITPTSNVSLTGYDTKDETASSDLTYKMDPLYLNILPTPLSVEEEITTTIYFSNNTYIVIEKAFSEDFIKENSGLNRATHNTLGIDCDLSSGSYSYTKAYTYTDTGTTTSNATDNVTSSKTVGGVTTTVKELKYMIGGEEFETNTTAYKISSKEDMYALAALTNAGWLHYNNEYTFTLDPADDENTIDLGENWIPIGYFSYYTDNMKHSFKGIFDGGGNTIKYKAEISNAAERIFISLGLFGYVAGENTMVKNLLINDSECIMNKSGSHAGILTGTLEAGASILNCGSESGNSVIMNARGAIGGLIGAVDHNDDEDDVYIGNSYNLGSVSAYGIYDDNPTKSTINIGGLCGSTYGNTTLKTCFVYNCYNAGSVKVYDDSKDELTESSGGIFDDINKGLLIGELYSKDDFNCLYYEYDYSDESNEPDFYEIAFGSETSITAGYTCMTKEEMTDSPFVDTLDGGAQDLYNAEYELHGTKIEVTKWTTGTGGYPTLDFGNYITSTTEDTSDGTNTGGESSQTN